MNAGAEDTAPGLRETGLLDRTFPFEEAPAAYQWLDEHPHDAVKVALAYGTGTA